MEAERVTNKIAPALSQEEQDIRCVYRHPELGHLKGLVFLSPGTLAAMSEEDKVAKLQDEHTVDLYDLEPELEQLFSQLAAVMRATPTMGRFEFNLRSLFEAYESQGVQTATFYAFGFLTDTDAALAKDPEVVRTPIQISLSPPAACTLESSPERFTSMTSATASAPLPEFLGFAQPIVMTVNFDPTGYDSLGSFTLQFQLNDAADGRH